MFYISVLTFIGKRKMFPHFLRKYIFIFTAGIACQSVEATKRNHDEAFLSSEEKLSKIIDLNWPEIEDCLFPSDSSTNFSEGSVMLVETPSDQSTLVDVPKDCRDIILEYCDLSGFMGYAASHPDFYEHTRPIIEALRSREAGKTDDGRVILAGYDSYRDKLIASCHRNSSVDPENDDSWKNVDNFHQRFSLLPKEVLYIARFQLYTLMNGDSGLRPCLLTSVLFGELSPLRHNNTMLDSKQIALYKQVLYSLPEKDLNFLSFDIVHSVIPRMTVDMFKSCDSLPFLKFGLEGTLSKLKGDINSKSFRCDSYQSLQLINNLTYPLLNPLMRKYIGELRTLKKQSIKTESITLLDQVTEIPFSLSNVVTKNAQVFDRLYKEKNPEHIYGFLKMVLALYGCPFYSFDALEMLEPNLFRRIYFLPMVYETDERQREIYSSGFQKLLDGLNSSGKTLTLASYLYEQTFPDFDKSYEKHPFKAKIAATQEKISLVKEMKRKMLGK